mgnify:FL=1
MATDESQHESDPATSFDKWFSGRPKWLQTAAHDVFSSRRMPSDDDIIALANLCRAEADGDDTAQFRALPAEAFADSREQAILRLAAIENLTGVNALRDGAAVNFDSSAISVVFGLNGSGKSGFSRVLKQACGCRGREPVHRNVFRPSPPTPSATIRFSRGDVPSEFKWSADGPPSPSLRDVHVFDSRTASMYVSAKNEATYEPRRMRFLSSMASICDRVHAVLESQKCALVSSLPKLPEAFRETKAAGWLSSVRASTSLPEIDERCTFTAELAEERKRLEAALAGC